MKLDIDDHAAEHLLKALAKDNESLRRELASLRQQRRTQTSSNMKASWTPQRRHQQGEQMRALWAAGKLRGNGHDYTASLADFEAAVDAYTAPAVEAPVVEAPALKQLPEPDPSARAPKVSGKGTKPTAAEITGDSIPF